MARSPYDPVKAHEYYERTKQLKGRKKGSSKKTSTPNPRAKTARAKAKVLRLKSKVTRLKSALSEAEAALSKARQASRKKAKAGSDGKSTAKERRASKEYREKNQSKLKSKASKGASGGSSKASKSSGKSVSDMSATQLRARIIKIKGALREAQRQLQTASQSLGQMAHSEIVSRPGVNEHFARFQSVERIPSNESGF